MPSIGGRIMGERRGWRGALAAIFAMLAAIIMASAPAGPAAAAGNLINHGNRAMQNQVRAFFIFWQPPGVVYDTALPDGVGNFKTLLGRFANDVSGSSYLNILTQYPGVCSNSPCLLRNGAGAFALGGSFTDTRAYPNSRGTQANPLDDSDIRDEVTHAISVNGWTPDINAIFFVVTGVFSATGAPVEECQGNIFSRACTFDTFCAYHDHFGSNGVDLRYSYLSDASFNTAGCAEGLLSGVNGQLSSDREVALMSHELFEAITDPEVNTWVDDQGAELGDKCNQLPTTVGMNGSFYNVQLQWSNATSSCMANFGPSIRLTVATGNDDLRGDSSVAADLQFPSSGSFETFTAKQQADAGWGSGATRIAVGAFNQPSAAALGRVALTLTSHDAALETNDHWTIQSITIEVLDPTGSTLCSQTRSGSPVASIQGDPGTATFDTPACQPPPPPAEAVQCHVFNDGYANMSLASGAVFINASHQACIPDGTASGTCRKWFGRCVATPSGRTVTMNVFDDGYANMAGPTDAVFINGSNQACMPSGTASGTCRKWFGRGQASDGHPVSCHVFDDGNTNVSLPSDAVFINGSRQSCIPDSTAHGTCARWSGLCTAP
jgi:hypothetical protein